MAHIISICNQKGGSGKSTTTLNIGAALAQTSFGVLLVDFDPQASLTAALGISREVRETQDGVCSLIEAILRREPLNITPISRNGVDVLPSNIRLSAIEQQILLTAFGREYILSKLLADIRDEYDFILIDCPASLGILTINALAASDSVIVPLKAQGPDFEVLPDLINTLNDVRMGTNHRLPVDGIVLTMYNGRLNLTKAIEDALPSCKLPIFETRISAATQVAEASTQGESILNYAPKSKAAAEYIKLTDELLKIKRG
jgi:chromosome partitioning protein